ncbi:MAG TPA: uroporphyrinogen-III synthase [Chloroflexota bacterium]
MSRPAAKLRARPAVVLNTRPRQQAGHLSRLLEQAGFVSVEAPAIATLPAWDPAELDSIRHDLRTGVFAWVALASQNAARGLEADLDDVRLVCGAATATALGVRAEIVLERFSASTALAALAPRIVPGQRVLIPRAAGGRDELIDGLRAIGASVHAPIAYRTSPADDAAQRLRHGGIDVVALCSPSAVTSVAPAVPDSVLVACLGQTTTVAARQAGLEVHAVADSTSMAALVAAIERLIGVGV